MNDFNPPASTGDLKGKFSYFNQEEVVAWDDPVASFIQSAMRPIALLFVPDSCSTTTCKLHIGFHGCGGSSDDFAFDTDLVNFAATNNIILVFPNSFCNGLDP